MDSMITMRHFRKVLKRLQIDPTDPVKGEIVLAAVDRFEHYQGPVRDGDGGGSHEATELR